MPSVILRLAVLSQCAWPSLQEDFWQLGHSASTWREAHPLITIGDDTVLMLGGCTNSSACPENQVWQTRDRGYSWTPHGAIVPWSSRNFHSAVFCQSSVVLLGGFGESTKNEHLNDVWALAAGSNSWTLQTSSAGWSERRSFGAVALANGAMLVMGGFATFESLNDIWQSADLGVTWTQVGGAAPWTARYSFALVVLSDDTIVLMGGAAQGDLNDVWSSTTNGASWTLQNPNAQWSKRSGPQAVALSDDTILLMGGSGYLSGKSNDVWRGFNYGVMWTPVVVASSWPGGRDFYVTITEGNILVLVEGSDAQNVTVWTNTEYFLTTSTTSHETSTTFTSTTPTATTSTDFLTTATTSTTTVSTIGTTVATTSATTSSSTQRIVEAEYLENITGAAGNWTVGAVSVKQEEEHWEDKDYSIVIGIIIAVLTISGLGAIGFLLMWKSGVFSDNAKIATNGDFSNVFGETK